MAPRIQDTEEAIAVLNYRLDEATRDLEIAFGIGLTDSSRAVRAAKARFERALRKRRLLEQGYQAKVYARTESELIEIAELRRRKKYEGMTVQQWLETEEK